MAAVCVLKLIPPEKINDPNNPGQKVFFYLVILYENYPSYMTKN
jgi:hypothetical protein